MAKQGVSLQKVKEQNLISILHVIREHGPVTRAQLSQRLGLSNTTCMELTRDLASMGIILETGQGDSSGGRKPILLEMNWKYGYVLGVILSQEGVSCGVYDLRLNQKQFVKHAVKLTAGKDIIKEIKSCALEAVKKSRLRLRAITGMTIGVGGLVDAVRANIVGSTHFQTSEIIRIHEELDSVFPFPLYLENYGNLLALAEKKLFYQHCKSLVYVLVDEGIGGGVISNDQILRGANGYAGEIGHMSVDRNGPPCFCGNRGCLEVMGSIPALLRKAAPQFKTMDALAAACADGNKTARRLVEEEADLLSHAVLNLILTHDPEAIVLGGDITLFADAFLDRIRSFLNHTIFDKHGERRLIAFSKLAEQPRSCGAGMYAVDAFFSNPLNYPEIFVQNS